MLTKFIKLNMTFKAICLLPLFFLGGGSLAIESNAKSATVSCALSSDQNQVYCDYRYGATLEVKDIGLKISGKVTQIAVKGHQLYPVSDQKTALLFLIDISDPRRKFTVEKKNIKTISEMLLSQKKHHLVGIATFDSNLEVVAPIGSDEVQVKSAVSKIQAKGQATEFYKNILSAIEILKKNSATRKGLILMSDGKDEDKAYTQADVLKAAKDAGVVILGLGYSESQADSPYLQTIKRLSEETDGLYFDNTNQIVPLEISAKPFSFVEKGGRITIDIDKQFGEQEMTLVIGLVNGQSMEIKAKVDLPDKRNHYEKFIDHIKQFKIYYLFGFLSFVLFVILFFIRIKHKKSQMPVVNEYAYLDEMDGLGTRHTLIKTAVCIGRSEDNDICLTNSSISLHHAEIHRRREGDFYIVDLASTNGVYVNDTKVSQIGLRNSDLIELGEVRLRFLEK